MDETPIHDTVSTSRHDFLKPTVLFLALMLVPGFLWQVAMLFVLIGFIAWRWDTSEAKLQLGEVLPEIATWLITLLK